MRTISKLGLSARHHSNDVCVFMHGTQILFLLLEMMSQGIKVGRERLGLQNWRMVG